MKKSGSTPSGLCGLANKTKKYRWTEPTTGNQLTAGGILFFDDKGIWVVGERNKLGVVYTDIGGKYNFEDGTIFATIARELGEETYHSCSVSTQQIEKVAEVFPFVYVNGHQNLPVYACLVVPVTFINGVVLDPKIFEERRQKIFSQNPFVQKEKYASLCLKYLTFEEIRKENPNLSFRLKRILRSSRLGENFSPTSSVLLDMQELQISTGDVSDDE